MKIAVHAVDRRNPAGGADAPAPGHHRCRGAHQLWNDTDATVRFLSISSWANGPEICHYPDSGKVGVYDAHGGELYKRATAVDYWEDEEPPIDAGSSSA